MQGATTPWWHYAVLSTITLSTVGVAIMLVSRDQLCLLRERSGNSRLQMFCSLSHGGFQLLRTSNRSSTSRLSGATPAPGHGLHHSVVRTLSHPQGTSNHGGNGGTSLRGARCTACRPHLAFREDQCAHQAFCAIYNDGETEQERRRGAMPALEPVVRVTRVVANGVDNAGLANVHAVAPVSLELYLSLSNHGHSRCQCNNFLNVVITGNSRVAASLEVLGDCKFVARATLKDAGVFVLHVSAEWLEWRRKRIGPPQRPWVYGMNVQHCRDRRNQKSILQHNMTIQVTDPGILGHKESAHDNCSSASQLFDGRYVRVSKQGPSSDPYTWVWQPNSCSMKTYSPGEALTLLKDRWILFVGDSTMKELQMMLLAYMQVYLPLEHCR